MTQKTALEVKPLVSPCYKAIKAIAGERKCPHCKGSGLSVNCPKCSGTGKVEWKWEPEVGEWYLCYCPGHELPCICLIKDEQKVEKIKIGNRPYDNVIPILHRERIEEILEEMGYSFSIDEAPHGETPDYRLAEHFAWIFDESGKVIARGKGKDRQTSAMLAVIELGKEI